MTQLRVTFGLSNIKFRISKTCYELGIPHILIPFDYMKYWEQYFDMKIRCFDNDSVCLIIFKTLIKNTCKNLKQYGKLHWKTNSIHSLQKKSLAALNVVNNSYFANIAKPQIPNPHSKNRTGSYGVLGLVLGFLMIRYALRIILELPEPVKILTLTLKHIKLCTDRSGHRLLF